MCKISEAKADAKNQGIQHTDADPNCTPHYLFVDDDIYTLLYNVLAIEQTVAASIEAMFILLGESALDKRQDPISWDKLEELPISWTNKILGEIINTRKLTVTAPPEYIAATARILERKLLHRRRFTLPDIEHVTGRLGHIATTTSWLQYLMSHCYMSIATALRISNAHLICHSHQYQDMLKLAKDKEAAHRHKTFAMSYVARKEHKNPILYNINTTLHHELKLIYRALTGSQLAFQTPIAHLILREPRAVGDGDASLKAGGGCCKELNFWWYLKWPAEVREFTLRYIKNNKNGTLICINALEYVSLLITYLACTYYLLTTYKNPEDPTPALLLRADNKSAETWAHKASKKSMLGRLLGRLQYMLMLQNPVGLKVDCISTTDNVVSVRLSRIESETNLTCDFDSLCQDFPWLSCCRRFRPSADTISLILDILLQKKSINPLKLKQQLLEHPDRITI